MGEKFRVHRLQAVARTSVLCGKTPESLDIVWAMGETLVSHYGTLWDRWLPG